MARFLGKDEAIVFNMGYGTNATTIPALCSAVSPSLFGVNILGGEYEIRLSPNPGDGIDVSPYYITVCISVVNCNRNVSALFFWYISFHMNIYHPRDCCVILLENMIPSS